MLTNYDPDLGLLLMRIGIGIIMIFHGLPKLVGGPKVWHEHVGASLGLYGVKGKGIQTIFGLLIGLIEVGGGLLFALGTWFQIVCLILAIEMLGAVSQHMFNQYYPAPLRTFSTGWSHALALAVVFIAMFFIGPGNQFIFSF